MKAFKSSEALFTPINLVLETQAEVDAIYAILNNTTTSRILGLGNLDYKALKPYANSDKSNELHRELGKSFA